MSSFYGNGGYSSGGGGGSGEVISVNGKKGRVTLDAADVHALPDSTQIPSLEGFATEAWVQEQGYATEGEIPTNVSALSNDAGYLSDAYYLVTVTQNGNTYTADHSYTEVYEAYQAGKIPVLVSNGSFYPFIIIDSNMVNFGKTTWYTYTNFSLIKQNNYKVLKTTMPLAKQSDIYTKTEIDTALQVKADKTEIIPKPATAGTAGQVLTIDANGNPKWEDDYYKPYATDTASGAVASFMDGADDIPLKSLVVNIDPVQDLHGYDSPWPAGGGKNLIDSRLSIVQGVNTGGTWNNNVYTLNGLTFTVADDGHITINGTSTASTFFTVYQNSEGITLPAGSYVLHKSGSADIIVATPKDGSYWTSATTNDSVVTLTESARISYYIQIQSGKTISNYNLYPMFESGTTATSWSPYENICPISGWDGMTVNATGKNLLNPSLLKDQSGWNNIPVKLKPNTAYTMSSNKGTQADTGLALYFNNTNTQGGTDSTAVRLGHPITVTSTSEGYVYVSQRIVSGEGSFQNYQYQIELGSTATDYAPYSGTIIPIDWQTEAGTVYGGSLDVLSGVLTVDRAMVDLGTLTWTKDANRNGNFYTGSISNIANTNFAIMCSSYAVNNTYGAGNIPDGVLSSMGSYGYGRVFVKDTTKADLTASEFKSAMDGVQLVCTLATLLTYQLTPHEVKSLLGQNNIFADTGDSAVEYRADTKMYIERLTEPDADMIADANITSGSYFMVGNSLYLATANIASGSAVIEGTNATRKSLSEALNEINV